MKKRLLATILLTASMLAACSGGDTETTSDGPVDGEKVVKASCATCHGGNLEGKGNTPALNDVGGRLTEAEILAIIEDGLNNMPPNLVKGEDAAAAAKWLSEQK